MAKIKTRKTRTKSFFEKLKHLLEKRGQGLPMTTIVIIVIVLIVLAVVIVFFFGQFSAGQKTTEAQQQVGTSLTEAAKCNAWAAGMITLDKACDPTVCSVESRCRAVANKVVSTCGVAQSDCTPYQITI